MCLCNKTDSKLYHEAHGRFGTNLPFDFYVISTFILSKTAWLFHYSSRKIIFISLARFSHWLVLLIVTCSLLIAAASHFWTRITNLFFILLTTKSNVFITALSRAMCEEKSDILCVLFWFHLLCCLVLQPTHRVPAFSMNFYTFVLDNNNEHPTQFH